jgi:hypothetical protein
MVTDKTWLVLQEEHFNSTAKKKHDPCLQYQVDFSMLKPTVQKSMILACNTKLILVC